jgi:ABC-type phosphate transport system permease subunit
MYISVLTLTGMDYPQNATIFGNLITAITAVVSIYIFAIPIGILASVFTKSNEGI